MQRENPAVHGGRESRQHRQLFAPAGHSHTQPRRHDRPHVGTIGQSRDSDPTLAGYPLRERRGYRHKTTRYLRIPHGIGVTGAWHSLHSSVCERKFPTLPHSGGVGSRAVYGAEDVTDCETLPGLARIGVCRGCRSHIAGGRRSPFCATLEVPRAVRAVRVQFGAIQASPRARSNIASACSRRSPWSTMGSG
jgi:hypothetical protein